MKTYKEKKKLFYSLIVSCISIMGLSQTAPVQKFHDTKGNIEVTQAGQLQYTMTIDTPPGIQKVGPSISLVYVSGAGNGLAGYGWNISGVTAISRVGKNLEKDGVTKNVQLDYSDYYSFNGQRLILKSGEYGKDGAEYVTEKYSNVKIKSVGAVSGQSWQGPEYWEVTSPDGSQIWYGATASGNSPARTAIDYNIVKSIDTNGNYISYNYTNEGNVSVISSIEWGGNETQNTPHFNKIEFVFASNPISEKAYIKGVEFSQSKLLESILVSSGGNQYKKYNVSYKQDVQGTSYRYLNKVSILNSKNEEANPVVFTYEQSGQIGNIPSTKTTALKPSVENDVVGDFDGDGNLDLLRYHSSTSPRISQPGVYLYKDFYSITYNTESPVFINSTLQQLKDAIAVNLKSDNKIDNRQGLVTRQAVINPSTSKYDIELSFYSITENNQLILNYKRIIPNASWDNTYGTTQNGTRSSIAGLKNIDFNGDGLSEIIVLLNDKRCRPIADDAGKGAFECTDSKRYYVVDPDQSTLNNGWFYNLSLYHDPDKRDKDMFTIYKSGDFNGDGVFDLLKLDENQKPQLITFQKNAQGQYVSSIAPFKPSNDETIEGIWEKGVVGDYNGDGLSDIMLPQAINSVFWNKYTSKGNGFIKENVKFEEPSERMLEQHGPNFLLHNPQTFVAYDINNDGKTELLALKSKRGYTLSDSQDNNNMAKYFSWTEMKTSVYSLTGGYGTMESTSSHGVYLNHIDSYTLHLNESSIPAEVAPNLRDLMGLSVDQWTGAMLRKVILGSAVGYSSDVGEIQRIVSHPYYDIAKEGRIKSISQGGITTEIVYKQLDKKGNPGLYDNIATPNYPYVEINQSVGMHVVSQMAQSITADKKLKQDFLYRGLTSNILGRGMVGFRKTARSSWYADGFENTKIWSGVEIDPVNEGIPVKEWSVRTPNDYSKIFPADVSENNSGLLSFKSTSYQIDKLLNGQVVTTVPDADKAKAVTAIVPKTTKTKDFLTGVVSENNIIYGSYYLPDESITSINGNFGLSTKKMLYTHNPSGQGKDYYIGRLSKNVNEETAYSDLQRVTAQYTYENNRLKTVATTGGNDTGRAVTDEFTYDGFGNITQKVTSNAYDAGKQTEKNEYDSKGRFIIKKTDNLGLEIQFAYNDWGQLVSQTDAFGNTLTHNYDDWGKLLSSTSNIAGTTTYNYEKDSNSNVTVTRNDPDGDQSKVFTNKFGQEYKTSAKAFGQGLFVSKETQYDILGRKIKESEPYFEGQSASYWNTIVYDDSVYPAKVIATAFNGKRTETTISGLTTGVKEQNGYGRTNSKTTDALGNIISSTDSGGTVEFAYNGAGKQIKAQYEENIVTTKYDEWGRKIEFNDPSNGLYKYEYDGLGRIKKTTSPKGTKEYTYNALGQIVSQKEFSTVDSGQTTNKTIAFTYNGKGQLTEKAGIIKGQPFGTVITYDSKGRILSSTENSNGKTYIQKNIVYDEKDRISSYEKELQSAGVITKVTIENVYSPWNGELYQMKDKTSGKILWELQQTNAKGQMLQEKLGLASINNVYDANGFLTGVNHSSAVKPSILQLSYSFDAIKNELKTRTTGGDFNITESFDYDDNNRLVNWTNPITGTKPSTNRNIYDIKGRIEENDQVGTMKYENSAKIYQPTGMTLNAEGIQNYNGDLIQSIVYNENNDPTQISGEKSRIFFDYGLSNMRQRVSFERLENGIQTGLKTGVWDPEAPQWKHTFTKFYNEDGSFEIVREDNTKKEKHILYIGGNPYESNIVYLRDYENENGSYKFLHKDYIGSVLAISDEAGNKLEQRHYDAWGNFTHLKIGNEAVITDKSIIAGMTLLIDRGYTSHEHLMNVGIIHMNGRLYDPLLRRFLNADENIQEPTNTQNYNKYGYVMNNPLMYNDPSGEYLQYIIGAIVGGYLNGVAANNGNWNPVKWDWQKSWGAVVGGAIGGAAVSGALGNISSNAGAIKNVLPGLVSGGLNSAFNGGNFLGGAIGGVSYSGNLFNNKITSTDMVRNSRYMVASDAGNEILGKYPESKSKDPLSLVLMLSGLNPSAPANMYSFSIIASLFVPKDAWIAVGNTDTMNEWGKDYIKFSTGADGLFVDPSDPTIKIKGITNPITGKIILAPALLNGKKSNYGLGDVIIHEVGHFENWKKGILQGNHPFIQDLNEVSSYLKAGEWTGTIDPGINDYLNSITKYILNLQNIIK
ncbi:RHS repeat-associated core domain-containing protein [Chryseobacterium sp. 22458]|uniref:RHS repeat-associated core domain-containing protein n=1 Tax=Chryseobacterium sp. 22458 TaxID=3453921 RepID=UPI003F85DB4B